MNASHTVEQNIEAVTVWNGNSERVEIGAYEPEAYRVGFDGVTRIEACEKPGEYCLIPYIRVWRGDLCLAEFGQHKVVGVYFEQAPIEKVLSPPPADHTGKPDCICDDCIPF